MIIEIRDTTLSSRDLCRDHAAERAAQAADGERRQLAATFAAWVRSRGRLPPDFEPLKRAGASEGGHLLVSLKGRDQAIIRAWPSNITFYSASESAGLIGLANLGMAERERTLFQRVLQMPHGIALVTGPMLTAFGCGFPSAG